MKFLIISLLFAPLMTFAAQPLGEAGLIQKAWYLQAIGLPQAWDLVRQTTATKVAVIDMDFDLANEDIRNAFDWNLSKDFSGNNFTLLSRDAESTQHGTLVSALLAADGFNSIGTTGVIRRGSIMALNIAPVGPQAIDIEQVIRYAVDSGAKVINGSFGYPSISKPELEKLKRAVTYAASKDVLLVFSAGNYHEDIDEKPFYPASLNREFPNVISVGASNELDNLSHVSNFGPRHVDLVAPGDRIIAPYLPGLYKLSDGTSEAAPIVSGVAALMRDVNPRLTAQQIKKILLATVDKSIALKDFCGSAGRINALNAIRAAISAK